MEPLQPTPQEQISIGLAMIRRGYELLQGGIHMITLTRQTGEAVGVNSRRVLYVDSTVKYTKGAHITMNNGDVVEVQESPAKVIRRVDRDRRRG